MDGIFDLDQLDYSSFANLFFPSSIALRTKSVVLSGSLYSPLSPIVHLPYSPPTSCTYCGFRYYFTRRCGVLFTFPSRYLFTIDLAMYLALPRERGRFPPGFSCPVVLRYANQKDWFISLTGLSPSMVGLSRHLKL